MGKDPVVSAARRPFSDIAVEFLSKLSAAIRQTSQASEFPDMVYLGFWCRRANLERLRSELGYDGASRRVGIGIVFHVAPSNVPLNFVFSFIFGLLAGNANIVKLPSVGFRQMVLVCRLINELLSQSRFENLRGENLFVRYERDNDRDAAYSRSCQGRVIWGGDKTVNVFKGMDTAPRCVDMMFADRYSMCLLNGDSINKLSSRSMSVLSEQFVNDSYWMDQKACSSPHLIIWAGENLESAKERFWKSVDEVVSTRFVLSEGGAVEKYSSLCNDAIKHNAHIEKITKNNPSLYRIELHSLPRCVDELRGVAGYFFEYRVSCIHAIRSMINEKFQTMTYFGFSEKELTEGLMESGLLGVDRIVPVGRAHDIGLVWDGYNIIERLSRIVDIQ